MGLITINSQLGRGFGCATIPCPEINCGTCILDFGWECKQPEPQWDCEPERLPSVCYTPSISPDSCYCEDAEYAWDFGDGNTSDEMLPCHTFDGDDPEYEVTLTVTCPGDVVLQKTRTVPNCPPIEHCNQCIACASALLLQLSGYVNVDLFCDNAHNFFGITQPWEIHCLSESLNGSFLLTKRTNPITGDFWFCIEFGEMGNPDDPGLLIYESEGLGDYSGHHDFKRYLVSICIRLQCGTTVPVNSGIIVHQMSTQTQSFLDDGRPGGGSAACFDSDSNPIECCGKGAFVEGPHGDILWEDLCNNGVIWEGEHTTCENHPDNPMVIRASLSIVF